MSSFSRIRKEDAVLVVIDIQTRMMSAIYDAERVIAESAKLIRGCRIMDVPILVTQQYTKGLGETVEPILTALTEDLGGSTAATEHRYIEKLRFSAMGDQAFVSALKNHKKKSVIICGVEGHVCLRQSVLDLMSYGYKVFVACDCVSSRKERDLKPAFVEMSSCRRRPSNE